MSWILPLNRCTTPQAPWTPNWRQNAPAERPLNVEGRIHTGIKLRKHIIRNEIGQGRYSDTPPISTTWMMKKMFRISDRIPQIRQKGEGLLTPPCCAARLWRYIFWIPQPSWIRHQGGTGLLFPQMGSRSSEGAVELLSNGVLLVGGVGFWCVVVVCRHSVNPTPAWCSVQGA